MIKTREYSLQSEGNFSIFPITGQVNEFLKTSGLKEGQILVYYLHTTGAVLVLENEAGILSDLEEALDRLIPLGIDYKHHLRGVDQNGCAHIRSALIGPSIALPVVDGRLLIGRYQEIVILDMQTDRNPRRYVLQANGEG